jgi:hypothetical protein
MGTEFHIPVHPSAITAKNQALPTRGHGGSTILDGVLRKEGLPDPQAAWLQKSEFTSIVGTSSAEEVSDSLALRSLNSVKERASALFLK